MGNKQQKTKNKGVNTKSLLDTLKATQEPNRVNPSGQVQGQPYDFSKSHLHIGLPCYGGLLYVTTMTAILKFILMAQQVGLSWSIDTMVNESLVTRARNNLMAKMMTNTAATHFMFIDSDIGFEPEAILHMISADKDIIAGLYPKKTLPVQYNLNLDKTSKIHGPLFTVDTAATGFLMYKRKVYQDLIDAHPEWKYVDDVGLGKQYEPMMYSVFDCYIDDKGHYLSEDWAFCRRAKALGYDIWADSRVCLNHTGTHEYKGDLGQLDVQNLANAAAQKAANIATSTPTVIVTEPNKYVMTTPEIN